MTNKHRWLYVETVRVTKATGKISKSLKIKLCKGREEIQEFKLIDSAVREEKALIDSGAEFANSINEYIDDYKLSVEARWKNKTYKSKLFKIRPKYYKLFLKGEYDPK